MAVSLQCLTALMPTLCSAGACQEAQAMLKEGHLGQSFGVLPGRAVPSPPLLDSTLRPLQLPESHILYCFTHLLLSFLH
jgi:hypothetical protein